MITLKPGDVVVLNGHPVEILRVQHPEEATMRFLDIGDLVDFVSNRLTEYPQEVDLDCDPATRSFRVVVKNATDCVVVYTRQPVSKMSLLRQITLACAMKRMRKEKAE